MEPERFGRAGGAQLEEFKAALLSCRTVAVTGTHKNTGKTTTLNFILRLLRGTPLGVTSAGRDGETLDAVTSTRKPRVFIRPGTIVATAKSCLLKSGASFEILSASGISTPLGEVITARCRTCGFVELAGPSIAVQLAGTAETMRALGARLVLIDGALSRRSFAVPQAADGCVLCTGAAFCGQTSLLAEQTLHALWLLSLPQVEEQTAALFDAVMGNAAVAFVHDGHVETPDAVTCSSAATCIAEHDAAGLQFIFLKGAVTDRFLNELLDAGFAPGRATLVAQDGTKLFFGLRARRRFLANGGRIAVRRATRVLAVSVNPVSPEGGMVDCGRLCGLMREKTTLPVFNVRKFGLDVME